MKSRGFTLIEVMIVVAIFGILAAVALPAYQQWASGGRPEVRLGPSQSNGTVVNSTSCSNGVLLINGQPVVSNGVAVKC